MRGQELHSGVKHGACGRDDLDVEDRECHSGTTVWRKSHRSVNM